MSQSPHLTRVCNGSACEIWLDGNAAVPELHLVPVVDVEARIAWDVNVAGGAILTAVKAVLAQDISVTQLTEVRTPTSSGGTVIVVSAVLPNANPAKSVPPTYSAAIRRKLGSSVSNTFHRAVGWGGPSL